MSTWGSDPRGGRDRALGTLAALASGAGLVWLAGLTLGFLGGDGLDGSGFISRATATAFGSVGVMISAAALWSAVRLFQGRNDRPPWTILFFLQLMCSGIVFVFAVALAPSQS